MNRIAVFIFLMALPFMSMAKGEFGVLGGIKSDGGWTGSVAYYHNVWKLKLGPVVEFANIHNGYTFQNFKTTAYNASAFGANVNLAVPFPKGYIYPGVTARYRLGNDGVYQHKGLDYGFQAGVVYKVFKFLSVNVETGFRLEKINLYDGANKNVGKLSNNYIPILAGIRLAI